MKILYVTTVGITMRFFVPFVRLLLDKGHSVDIAANEDDSCVPECYREWGCRVFPLTTSRSPMNKANLRAIGQIQQLVNENHYDIVHCHTPVAAMCTRLACRKARRHGTKVLYTAHGFHFYRGAPLANWLFYFPVEWLLAHFTDVLITINQEDYDLAKRIMRAGRVEYVPGVGIDLTKFGQKKVDRAAKRRQLDVPENAALLLSVGELNDNKNHETVIRAIADLDVYYIIAGEGALSRQLQNVIDSLGISQRVKLLGFRNDVGELCSAADVFVFPSFREGLSVSVMEAMASGLPVVCSRIRGNTDLVDENGGILFDPHSVDECREALRKALVSDLKVMSDTNRERITEFSQENVHQRMFAIYNACR